MLTIPLTLAQAAACAYVLYVCVMVIHAMTGGTRHLIRLAYLLLAAGALVGVISAIPSPSIANALMAGGLALFLAGNERRQNAAEPSL